MRLFRELRGRWRGTLIYKYLDQFTPNAQLFLLSPVIGGLTFSGFQLFFNIFLRSRGYDLDFIGLLNAIPSGAALVVGVPMGIISDRLGRRRAMLIGLTTATLAAWALVATEAQGLMVLMSAVTGVANSLYFLSMAPFMMRASRAKPAARSGHRTGRFSQTLPARRAETGRAERHHRLWRRHAHPLSEPVFQRQISYR